MSHNLTSPTKAFAAMTRLENWEWAVDNDRMDDFSFRHVYNRWSRTRRRAKRTGDDTEVRNFSSVIYGCGGSNRYFVRGDGTVEFSAYHATDEQVERARELGFEIC